MSRPLRLSGPQIDPYAHTQHTDAFKEAERLAHGHGLTYLSISGVHKLSCLIAAVRAEHRNGEHPHDHPPTCRAA